MELSNREMVALVHGMLIGGPFLLAFTGALASLAGLRSEYLTAEGIRARVGQLRIGDPLAPCPQARGKPALPVIRARAEVAVQDHEGARHGPLR